MIDLNEVRLNVTPDDLPAVRTNDAEEAGMAEPARAPAESASAGGDRPEPGPTASEVSALKRKCLNLAAERELALALAGETLIPGVTDQLVRLLRDRIVAEESADQDIRVRSRDGRPVGEAVKEWLASPEYRHFRTASSRGGVLRRNESTMHAGPADFGTEPSARSLNEVVIERWKNRVRTKGKEGLWPRIP